MQKITPFLWFNGNAEEAIHFYTGIFKNSKIGKLSRTAENGPGEKGKLFTGSFILDGQEFMALNGGPMFSFTPAISFYVNCDTQEEIDEMWEKLSEGGEKQRCGWVRDKFGISWQIIPPILGELLNSKDPEKSKKVLNAMMQMDKIDIRGLKQAAV
jgi:predicted 3-demethylubiquinone-9 3-methyltransferase (glyoxalase superfamily)